VETLDSQGRLTYYTSAEGDSYPYMINVLDSQFAEMLEITEEGGRMGFVINTENYAAIEVICRLIAE